MTLSGRQYVCSAGEQIDLIALTIYGNEKYACELLCANPHYALTQTFVGGEVLDIPVVAYSANNPGAITMSDVAPWKG